MFCPSCGFEHEDGANFCMNCGKALAQTMARPIPISIEATADSVDSAPGDPGALLRLPPATEHRRRWLWRAAGGAVLVVVLAIGWYVVSAVRYSTDTNAAQAASVRFMEAVASADFQTALSLSAPDGATAEGLAQLRALGQQMGGCSASRARIQRIESVHRCCEVPPDLQRDAWIDFAPQCGQYREYNLILRKLGDEWKIDLRQGIGRTN